MLAIVKSSAYVAAKDENYQFIAGELSREVYEAKPITDEVTDGHFTTWRTYYNKPS
ncbi:MAG: hypothetical protein ABIX01_05120 [Chitinophagaceae bacterium]